MNTNLKERHIDALKSIGFTGSFLSLRRLEERAHRLAERYCNEEMPEGEYEREEDSIIKGVTKLFGGQLPQSFFVNSDPRGFALKVNPCPEGMHRDWGGYGILAPDRF